MLEVTGVKIRRLNGNSKLKAYVSVQFNNAITWNNVKLFDGAKGMFVKLPEELDKNGKKDDNGYTKSYPIIYIDFKNDIGKTLLNHITTEVVKAYHGSGSTTSQKSQESYDNPNEIMDDEIPF